jgi:O-antigen ligase
MDPRWPERALFILAVLLNAGLWIVAPHEDPEVGSPLQQIVLGLTYVAAIIGVVAERRTALRLMRGSMPLVLLVLLAVLSTLWSDESWITARRSFELLGAGALSLYFVCRLGLKGFVEAFSAAMAIAAALSVALIFLVPDIGRMQILYEGAWRGFFVHKNGLGFGMAWGMISVATVIGYSHGIRRACWIAAFVLMFVLLIGSQGATAVFAGLILALLASILLWSRAVRSTRPLFLITLLASVAILAAEILGFGIDDVLALTGRDATLTGRTDIWQIVLDAIADRPILGYGYQAYFASHTIGAWDPGHAHNGLLQAALDLGLIGVVLVIITFAVGITRASVSFWQGRDYLSSWPLLAIAYTMLTDVTEDVSTSDFRWIVFVAALFFATEAHQRHSLASEYKENFGINSGGPEQVGIPAL